MLNIMLMVLTISFLSLLLVSCNGTRWSQFADIDSRGWQTPELVEFRPERDSLNPDERFDVILCIRYKKNAVSPEACISLEEESLETEPSRVALRIPLLSRDGKPLGHGSHNLYETFDTLHRDFRIPDGYSVAVAPLPNHSPAGIVNVGLILSNP